MGALWAMLTGTGTGTGNCAFCISSMKNDATVKTLSGVSLFETKAVIEKHYHLTNLRRASVRLCRCFTSVQH